MPILLLVASLFLTQTTQRPEFASVSGRVLSQEGPAAARIRVAAMPVDEKNTLAPGALAGVGTSLISLTETDSEGRYRLQNLPPGRYLILAGSIELPSYYPGVRQITEARSVVVVQGQTLPEIDFPMARPSGLRVRGRVKPGPSRTPLAEIMATLQPTNSSAGQTLWAAISGAGTFEFLNVPPGSYNLRLSPGPSGPRIVVDDRNLDDLELLTTPAMTPDVVPPPARTPPPPGKANLYVSQSGRGMGTGNREGAVSFFRIEQAGVQVQEMRLDGSPAVSLTPGNYEFRTWLQGCDLNCNKLTAPQMECTAPFTVAAGEELLAERIKQVSTCTIQFKRP